MRNTVFAAALAVGIAVIAAGCPAVVTSFRVESPAANQTGSTAYDISNGKIRILVDFSRSLNMTTVLANTNVLLYVNGTTLVSVSVAQGSSSDKLYVMSQDDAASILSNGDAFTLVLLGSGDNPIYCTCGNALDGDIDNQDGGNWETTFQYTTP